MTRKKVAIALSGGVDSAVAAKLLLDQGYAVTGVHLVLADREGLLSARATAARLGIGIEVLDWRGFFNREIAQPFVAAYRAGLTPNPCVGCNQRLKFGRLVSWAGQRGFDFVATGHYARVKRDYSGCHLLSGRDKKKDQAYFLYRLTQTKLKQIIFPLGEWEKTKVCQFAAKYNLVSQKISESQDACFLAGGDYRDLLGQAKPGEIVTKEGLVIGHHSGLANYTIGQRQGFELISRYRQQFQGKVPAHLVVAKQILTHRLVVAPALTAGRTEFKVENLSWVAGKAPNWGRLGKKCVRLRSTGAFLRLKKVSQDRNHLWVILAKPEAGIAPGQHAVFYQSRPEGWEVLGGGEIRT